MAEDFGLDSESLDPEPHRHVVMFKTPRFHGAPMKTIRDCIRIRYKQDIERAAEAQKKAAETAARKANVEGGPAARDVQQWNAFLVTHARFALTSMEVENEIAMVIAAQESELSCTNRIDLRPIFMPSGDVLLRGSFCRTPNGDFNAAWIDTPVWRPTTDDLKSLTAHLKILKPSLIRAFNISKIGNVELCRISSSSQPIDTWQEATGGDRPTIQCRESDFPAPTDADGWSKVAAKAATSKKPVATTPVGRKSGFAILGNGEPSKNRKKKKPTPKKEVVAEDWEAEEEKVEKAEKEGEMQVEGRLRASTVEDGET